MDHKDNDCIIVVVLTHGDPGKLHAYDDYYDENKIWSPFLSCRSLIGKPKLFIIQVNCKPTSLLVSKAQNRLGSGWPMT